MGVGGFLFVRPRGAPAHRALARWRDYMRGEITSRSGVPQSDTNYPLQERRTDSPSFKGRLIEARIALRNTQLAICTLHACVTRMEPPAADRAALPTPFSRGFDDGAHLRLRRHGLLVRHAHGGALEHQVRGLEASQLQRRLLERIALRLGQVDVLLIRRGGRRHEQRPQEESCHSARHRWCGQRVCSRRRVARARGRPRRFRGVSFAGSTRRQLPAQEEDDTRFLHAPSHAPIDFTPFSSSIPARLRYSPQPPPSAGALARSPKPHVAGVLHRVGGGRRLAACTGGGLGRPKERSSAQRRTRRGRGFVRLSCEWELAWELQRRPGGTMDPGSGLVYMVVCTAGGVVMGRLLGRGVEGWRTGGKR